MADIKPLYKVIRVVDGRGTPCHGGSPEFRWPLPDGDSPGDWVSVDGPLELCRNAVHLTADPMEWFIPRDESVCLYLAEGRGEQVGGEPDTKIGFREARLLQPVDWSTVGQVYRDGEHSVTSGRVFASGTATVHASGTATVEASGWATVEASGSATVHAYDWATVHASGWARVEASGWATVHAYDSARVFAYGTATVEASGSARVHASGWARVEASGWATVHAYDSARVHASGTATVISTIYHGGDAHVALSQLAAHIDRRGGTLAYRDALGRTVPAAAE